MLLRQSLSNDTCHVHKVRYYDKADDDERNTRTHTDAPLTRLKHG